VLACRLGDIALIGNSLVSSISPRRGEREMKSDLRDWIDKWVWHRPLEPDPKLVLLCLSFYKSPGTTIKTSDIARLTGLSMERVQKAIQVLEMHGIIAIIDRNEKSH